MKFYWLTENLVFLSLLFIELRNIIIHYSTITCLLKATKNTEPEFILQDQKRMEKVSKRVNAIQEVKESVKLLTQLLADYSKDTSSNDNEELIKVTKTHAHLPSTSSTKVYLHKISCL